MASIARIPITNVYMGGDYTGQILVGAQKKPLNVILDTGSSALALDGTKYTPDAADKTTNLGQVDSYGDGSSWTGAVIQTSVTVGASNAQVVVADANVAIAYDESANMFRGADGILGLAYAPLDDAFEMPEPTWPKHYTAAEIQSGKRTTIAPYLTQLAGNGVVSDKVSFSTHRSFTRAGQGGIKDPLNNGVMIVGGGEEAKDLYTGDFQAVKVLADAWYNTNLKTVLVGNQVIHVPARGAKGMPSNSIVDSGTNSLNLGPQLLRAILAKLPAAQRALLGAAIQNGELVRNTALNFADWPALTFILQGSTSDVKLIVKPEDYWQTDTQRAGYAAAAITPGDDGLAILGLPLMAGYFTIFDGEADNGRGEIRFATQAPLAAQ